MYRDRRIFLFAGHYGSGKTEIAVNFAFDLARAGNRTAIVDFDIVNPYFRTSDAREALEAAGIRVIASQFANTNVDVPALPAEISSLFEDQGVKAVFDVGGDDVGAKAVSRYRAEFTAGRAMSFFVFNLRRPMTANLADAEAVFREVQGSARLNFDAIVNNTNLLSGTTQADLLEGLDAACELAARLGLPVAFSALMSAPPAAPTPAPTPASVVASSAAPTPAPVVAPLFFERSRERGIPVFCLSKYIHMDFQ
jgi:hypothetical protein